MKNEIGIMILSGCNPLLGVSKKTIEVLGNHQGFCLVANIEKKELMVIPDCGYPSAVMLSQTSQTKDYYWIRGIAVYRIMASFGISGENNMLFYYPASLDQTGKAVTCSSESSEVFDLKAKQISVEVRRFMSHNFHMKDRKNRATPNALDIKCCKTTPRKLYHKGK